MMTLKDVKDWLKTQVSADAWKIGTYDVSKDKTVCVRNLTSNRSMLAIGGLQNTTTAVKGISIVVHWNKNPDETERVAQSIHALFYGKQPVIGDYRAIKCDMRSDEPISVGMDASGIYEYVIEIWLTYERKE
ncbi:phage tail terminator protein [Longicatena caecimuris]|uniref:Minor capsid protein n=1 Tax=Longicatena caecimuris TaxID=1796635 RepID=A0A4R3TFA6_9FIRM|nr:minor capsid protein [Longicatena caecimuris]MCR1870181.1 minor capsid protein [Longicatena caecimuris]MCU0102698.1 minor capsid protein [Longicatena caecimuris]TCU60019.1 hypothetical protein EDD61_10956 [Longicatena caecimuris]